MANNTMAPTWSIYKATCLPNGKAYIGLTKTNPILRWRNHLWRVNSKTKVIGRFAVHNAIRAHGPRAFRLEVLSIHRSLKDASAAEQTAILAHQTLSPMGYNITGGGMGTPGFRKPHSEETKRKMAAAMKGRIITADARAKMSAAKKGKKLSPAHVALLSAIRKAKARPSEYYSRLSKLKTGIKVPIKSIRLLESALARLDAGSTTPCRQEHAKWSSRIAIGNKKIHLGMFHSQQEALDAYRKAVEKRLAELKATDAHQKALVLPENSTPS